MIKTSSVAMSDDDEPHPAANARAKSQGAQRHAIVKSLIGMLATHPGASGNTFRNSGRAGGSASALAFAPHVRVRDLNWMHLEAYLRGDDRIVLPVGSTEQHAYLSLETDNILAERASVEAAEPLGIPVLPALPYGVKASPRTQAAPRFGSPHWSHSSRTSSIRWSARGSRGSSL